MRLWYLLLIIMLAGFAAGAEIHGVIVDYSLEPVNKAIVTIDTVPRQTIVTTTGQYSFVLDEGNYTLSAKHQAAGIIESLTTLDISVVDNDSYRVDIILFPNVSEGSMPDIPDTDLSLPVSNESQKQVWFIGLFTILGILIILIVLYFFLSGEKKVPHYEDELREKVLKILQKEKRIMQKDLRKKVFISEPELSMLLSQLAHEKKIDKIKKGRSNLIVLK